MTTCIVMTMLQYLVQMVLYPKLCPISLAQIIYQVMKFNVLVLLLHAYSDAHIHSVKLESIVLRKIVLA